MKQLSGDTWKKGHYGICAQFPMSWQYIQEKFGYNFDKIYEDGLGYAMVLGILLDSGKQLSFECFLGDSSQTDVYSLCECDTFLIDDAPLNELLHFLNLDRSKLVWESPILKNTNNNEKV